MITREAAQHAVTASLGHARTAQVPPMTVAVLDAVGVATRAEAEAV